ncbi:putative secondary metabolism biosynthetic enzyme [Termitomyces sp. T32_za158]|nr:putative secondary metabolism biosynthetic enzyme [Termitomyces sp. T32_za158]
MSISPVLPILNEDLFVPDAIEFNMENNATQPSSIVNTPLADKLRIEETPSIASVYPYLAHETANHPFNRYHLGVQRPSRSDPCIYLHSSGSTGNPKPIPQNHVYWVQLSYPTPARIVDLRCSDPRFTLGGMSLPSFHTYGLAVQLFMPIYGVLSVTVFPPNSILPESLPPIVPSPENVIKHMKLTQSSAIETFPSFLQVWAMIPEAVEYLKTLRFVGWAGGPLALKLGNLLFTAGVILRPAYGGTEFGINTRFTPLTLSDPEDWEYMQFHDHMKIRWMPQGDGSYECQFLSHEKHETMLNNLSDAPGYATSDLWRPHPTKNGLWRIVGRIDDVIVHSSGEKTVPAPMEAIVVSDPLVHGAVIFGRERVQAGILIEPKPEAMIDVDDHAQLASLRNQLWPTVEEANRIAPAHSRIFKEMILFTSKEKPLPRAVKGSVTRKAALKIYEREIDAIDLAAFISSLLPSSGAEEYDVSSQKAAAMEEKIAKYSSVFEIPLPSALQSSVASPVVVLLTGSTGHLGSQILAMLLNDPRVAKVYTYNRPSDTKHLLQRHLDKFDEIGLDVGLLKSEKLVLISGDAAEANLGLDQDLYGMLRQTVNIVIHNAWRLDFNLSLASFESNIRGACHFIELARSGPNPLSSRFLFVSSIAAVQNWDKSKGAVPEDVIEDVSVALGGGYGEGKHIVERILLKSGLQALSIRVGQISGGSPRGVWPTTEWFPILIKSSVSLGTLPDASGVASWLGADTISATIVDLALSTHSTSLPRALNLVHPRPVRQSVVMKSIKKAITEILGLELQLIPFNQWFSTLEERAEGVTAGTLANIPAVKILEFFRGYAKVDASDFAPQSEAGGLPILSTETVQQISRYMSPERLQQIGDDDAKLWVSYWRSVGFLD